MEQSECYRPLLTIAIATKDRIPYAIIAIQSILRIADPRLELVIQDNSESRELESYLKANIRDSRLRYRYTPPPFSSIDNFNAALELSSGDYVCLIGDDDGVNPEIMDAVLWAQQENIDRLSISPMMAAYLWPNAGVSSTLFTKITGGVLSITPFKPTLIEINAEREMLALICNGGVYYHDFFLPKLYHGIVRRSCLVALHQQTGVFIGGLSPDIYAAISLSCIAKRVFITNYPLTLPGACKSSTSVSEGAQKAYSVRLEDAPHFRDRENYEWSKLVPRIYCKETIWAESCIAALDAMGRKDLIQKFSIVNLSAYCMWANTGLRQPVWSHYRTALRLQNRNLVAGLLHLSFAILDGPGIKFIKRVWNRILIQLGQRSIITIEPINDINDATLALTRHLRQQGQHFL